jgi:hypothetical protein
MTTSEQGAIEMAAGHVSAVNGGPRYQLDQQAGGGLHLLLKEIFMGLVQLTQDWLVQMGYYRLTLLKLQV